VLTFLAGAELDPAGIPSKMEGGKRRRPRRFSLPLSRLRSSGALVAGLGVSAELAGRRGHVDHVGGRCLRGHAGVRLNRTDYGKTLLAACFINDLVTVLALGFIFAPFTERTAIFAGGAIAIFAVLPWLTPRFFRLYGNRPSELEAKFLLLCLFGLGALASWADSEAVLPAYIVGMVLAGTVGKGPRAGAPTAYAHLRFLTPFYFIRAGSFVSVPALLAAPVAFLVMLGAKMLTKFIGVYPVTRRYRSPPRESI